ncbi:MAG: GNAT superfamily N-acetyltransferase [Phenylobacterium sp.]|jgi:GNAT superfamily N-acetyltransferase
MAIMNASDEHLIFGELELFAGYAMYPNEVGFVEVLTHMDMEICLQNHPNWPVIRQQPPVLVYDCPAFVSQSELMDYFCPFADNQSQHDHICVGLDGNEKRQADHQRRDYRLVIYSAEDPTKPIAFTSFDLFLSENVDQEDTQVNLIGLNCDFLYAYVIPEYRGMGIGAMLGLMMGTLYWAQIHHVWQQINESETALVPQIHSEKFGRGGQDIISTVLREIKLFSDINKTKGRITHLRMPRIMTRD